MEASPSPMFQLVTTSLPPGTQVLGPCWSRKSRCRRKEQWWRIFSLNLQRDAGVPMRLRRTLTLGWRRWENRSISDQHWSSSDRDPYKMVITDLLRAKRGQEAHVKVRR